MLPFEKLDKLELECIPALLFREWKKYHRGRKTVHILFEIRCHQGQVRGREGSDPGRGGGRADVHIPGVCRFTVGEYVEPFLFDLAIFDQK